MPNEYGKESDVFKNLLKLFIIFFFQLEGLSLRLEKHEGQATDLDEIRLAVLNIICAMVFGSRYELDNPEFKQILHDVPPYVQLFCYAPLFQILPWMQYLSTKVVRDVREVVSFRQKLCKRKLDEHKEKFDGEDIRDLTDSWLKATMDAEEESLEVKKCLTEEHVMMTIVASWTMKGSSIPRLRAASFPLVPDQDLALLNRWQRQSSSCFRLGCFIASGLRFCPDVLPLICRNQCSQSSVNPNHFQSVFERDFD